METIEELERYLEEECYSFHELTIGSHHAYEGIIIEKNGENYVFASSERGRRDVLKSFSNEKDLVTYAFQQLSSDKWYRGHLVAWVWSQAEIEQAEAELIHMQIAFERNDIPYSKGRNAYRIFVFGRDILLLDQFKRTYLNY